MLKKVGILVGILFLVLLFVSVYFVSTVLKNQNRISVLSEVSGATISISNKKLLNDRFIDWDVWNRVYVPLNIDNEIVWREMQPKKVKIIYTSKLQVHDNFADDTGPDGHKTIQSIGYSIEDNDELHIYIQIDTERLKKNDKRDMSFEVVLFRSIYYLTHKGIEFSEINKPASVFSKELGQKGASLHVSFN